MSQYIFQIITQQWDKSELSEQYVAERAQKTDRLPLSRETAFFAFEQQCIIDRQGDNVMGRQIQFRQIDADTIQIERFQITLSTAKLEFIGLDEAGLEPSQLGLVDDNFIQCKYEWRQRVFEGGYFYWLYEQVIFNAIKVAELNETVFLDKEAEVYILNERL